MINPLKQIVDFLTPEQRECQKKCKEKCLNKEYPDGGNGNKDTAKFVSGVISRVGGRYCSPPRAGCTDCSGLVAEEYFKATGRKITGDSHALYAVCTPIRPPEIQPGDLLFHNTGTCRSGNCDSHVGVAINDTERVDAMNPDMGIRRGPRRTPYWYGNFTHAGRLPW